MTPPATPALGQGPSGSAARQRETGSAVMGSAALTLAGSVAGALLTLVNEMLAASVLGPSDYGLYAIGIMLAKVGETIALFGLPLAILHFLPVHMKGAERPLALGVILGGAGMPVLLGGAVCATLWAGADWIANEVLRKPSAAPYILVGGLAVPMLAAADMLGNIARALGRPLVYVAVRNLITPVCYLAALLFLVSTDRAGQAVPEAYLAATAAGVASGVAFAGGIVWRQIGPVRPVLRLGRLYAYAGPIVVNSIFSLMIVWTDLLLLGMSTDLVTVGSYRACMLVVVAFDLVWNAGSAATAPIYPVLIAERQWARLQLLYGSAIRFTALIALPLLAAVASNAPDILGLLHPEYRAAGTALVVFAAGHAVKTTFGAGSVLLIVGGMQGREALNAAIAAALNLVLNLVLVPRYGALGAAAATSTTLTGISVLRCWQVRRAFRLRCLDAATLRAVLAIGSTALAVASAMAMAGAGPGSGTARFVLRVAVLGAAMAPVMWWACLSRPERAGLLHLLGRWTGAARPCPKGTS